MPSVCAGLTLAQRQSEANLRANLSALAGRGRMPRVPAAPGPEWEWVFARDGTLTVRRDADGGFWGGCSVPTRRARLQLRDYAPPTPHGTACLLAPAHPADARAALDRLPAEHALLVLIPNADAATVFLRADDFSAHLARGRVFIHWGEDWADQLRGTLLDHPGLAIPTQFIRLKSADVSAAEAMIAPAQAVFSEVTRLRAAEWESIISASAAVGALPGRLCVVAGSRFRLWRDAGMQLLEVLSSERGIDAAHFDVDDPLCATPLALARAAREATAVVAVDRCRADLPAGAFPLDRPWVAWLTHARPIPAWTSAGLGDALLVADRSLHDAAIAAGWPAARVRRVAWPTARSIERANASDGSVLAIIADVQPLHPPEDLNQFSSHRLLWEWLAEHLRRDTFASTDNAQALLRQGMQKLGVDEQGFPFARFENELVASAHAVGTARCLLSRLATTGRIELRLHGDGWDAFDDLRAFHRGPVRTRDQFRAAVGAATAVVHVGLTGGPHPIDAVGRPVVRRPHGQGEAALLTAVEAALRGETSPPVDPAPPLDARALLALCELRLPGMPVAA